MLAFLLLLIGIASRFIIHIPNFTPVVALALFSGAYLPKRYAVLFPLALMVISDIFIGLHETILFTWGSVALISILGFWTKHHRNPVAILSSSLFSAVFFFAATNFGTWLMTDLYPHTLKGLQECFVLAVPFFRATLLSTLVYTFVIFGLYEMVAARVKKTQLASVLFREFDP